MSQHHQLKILGVLSLAAQHQQSEHPPQRQIHERPQHHHLHVNQEVGRYASSRSRQASRTTAIEFLHLWVPEIRSRR